MLSKYESQIEEVERSDPSTTRSEERSLAERLLAKHQHEEHHSTLTVSVIEAKGLSPRSGRIASCSPILCLHAVNEQSRL